ncbi:glycoside hydrolase family 2 TIM barrel-domain containing protein [Allomuricauda sp. M10]|uniref:glycoside hydrolase family 2 TIM barrel-domain containing protein n=1 Tax=Allomuricauda sp. M10 TaxID=2683292 RepID=UPI001D181453|nr:glycoside hydrolase family 2 TIM barrel-domain containing protein [Muricauda sp. M10]
MVKKNLYRALLLLSFLAVNAGIIYGLAAAWSFLNTGADKSAILHIGDTIEQAYQPKITWTIEGQRGRKIAKQALGELEKDYLNAWYVKNIALNSYDQLGIADYYTEDARKQVENLVKTNQTNNIKVETTTLSHHPQLEFYSLDGKLAVLTDIDVVQFEKVYTVGTLVHQQRTSHSYKAILMLEDGFWRIRQMVKIPNPDLTQNESKQLSFDIKKWKGINYYPKDNPWNMFGKNFDMEAIYADFETITTLGLNSVRVFVPYEGFGGASVKEEMLGQLEELLDIAQEHNLKVLVTLFDFYGNYDLMDWTLTHRHAETIVTRLKSHEALLGWDIKNEPDLDFESRGKNTVLGWLSEMAQQIKQNDSIHPITIGWSTPEAALHLANEVDFVSFHYYEAPENFKERFLALKDSVDAKPLVLEEYGKSSYSGIWNLFSNSKDDQATYYEKMQAVLTKEQLPYFIWTLYDFETVPTSVVGRKPWRKAPQKHFGLMDSEGKEKPAYRIIDIKRKGDD